MLAAAGGPDVHPHAVSPAREWVQWERDVANFNRDVREIETFFEMILSGDLPEAEQRGRLFSFINTDDVPQGAFYTVGWKVAAIVERSRGRKALLPATCDPRLLLELYNEEAAAHPRAVGESLATWDSEFLRSLRSPP